MSDPATRLRLTVLTRASLFTSYCQVAVLTFLVCDHAETLAREIKLVWNSRWSLAKFIFVISRYTPYALLSMNIRLSRLQLTGIPGDGGDPRDECGNNLDRIITWLGTIATTSAEAFFCLEAYSICKRSRAMLVLFCIAGFVIVAARIILNILRNLLQYQISTSLPVCFVAQGNPRDATVAQSYSFINQISSVCSCIILMCCILFVRWKTFGFQLRTTPMIDRVYRGALSFYCLQLCFNILAIILVNTSFASQPILVLIANPAVASVITSRVILDVREMGAEDCFTSTIFPADGPASALRFRSRATQSAADDLTVG